VRHGLRRHAIGNDGNRKHNQNAAYDRGGNGGYDQASGPASRAHHWNLPVMGRQFNGDPISAACTK
jgi:hypothetical protein